MCINLARIQEPNASVFNFYVLRVLTLDFVFNLVVETEMMRQNNAKKQSRTLSRDLYSKNLAYEIVSGGQRYDHETPILRQLKWLSVKQHLFYHYPIMASKFMNCLVPEYLSDQFIKRSSVSTSCSRNSQLLNIPLFRSATGQRNFYYRIVSLWNALPQNIKLSQSLAQFKTDEK